MNIHDLYNKLNSENADNAQLFTAYVKAESLKQRSHPEMSEQIAYNIAGLMSTAYAQRLPEDHPHMQILFLAGTLELPAAHRGGADWRDLQKLIEKM